MPRGLESAGKLRRLPLASTRMPRRALARAILRLPRNLLVVEWSACSDCQPLRILPGPRRHRGFVRLEADSRERCGRDIVRLRECALAARRRCAGWWWSVDLRGLSRSAPGSGCRNHGIVVGRRPSPRCVGRARSLGGRSTRAYGTHRDAVRRSWSEGLAPDGYVSGNRGATGCRMVVRTRSSGGAEVAGGRADHARRTLQLRFPRRSSAPRGAESLLFDRADAYAGRRTAVAENAPAWHSDDSGAPAGRDA